MNKPTYEQLEEKIKELQRQLDEQAKHEPVGIGARWPEEADKRILYLLWTEVEIEETESVGMEAVKLYALPPNLRAMIEQAVKEEREACAKVCESMIENIDENYAAKRPDEAEGDYIANAVKQNCADAIRARGEKI